MPKVAMVVFSVCPADVRVRREAEALVREGYEVDIFCLREKHDPAFEKASGITYHRLSVPSQRGSAAAYILQYLAFFMVAAVRLSWRHLSRKYDVVHVHNMPDFLVFTALIPRLSGARVLLDMHDPMPEVFMAKFEVNEQHFAIRLLRFIEKFSLGFADKIITPNQAFKRVFADRGCSREKIGLVMNSPQEDIFEIAESALQTGNEIWPANKFRVMYHGTIVHRHGLDLAIRAIVELKRKIPGIEFHIYGDGDASEACRTLIADLDCSDYVIFHGLVDLKQIARAIQGIDLGLIPNRKSAFTQINLPTRIFEYLSANKPVIVPRTLGIGDYFDDETIYYFERESSAGIADVIYTLWQNPNEVIERVNRGHQIYRQHTWQKEQRELCNVVNKLAGLEPGSDTPLPPRVESADRDYRSAAYRPDKQRARKQVMKATEYMLMTAARNEAEFIGSTILSVVEQTILPKAWIIVNDGSTDETEAIIRDHAARYKFIKLVTRKPSEGRNFGSKANCLQAAWELLKDKKFDLVGNLDADITLRKNYYEQIMLQFAANPRLGLAGGSRQDLIRGKFTNVACAPNSVGGPIQMFRRACYEEIGGYLALKNGGIDAAAEIMARMQGWRVQTFEDLKVYHHRQTGTALGGLLPARFRAGRRDWFLGYGMLFQLLRFARAALDRPVALGSLAGLAGYVLAALKKQPREVPQELVSFLRNEQSDRMRRAFRLKSQHNQDGLHHAAQI